MKGSLKNQEGFTFHFLLALKSFASALRCHQLGSWFFLLLVVHACAGLASAATISGFVLDLDGGAVSSAQVNITGSSNTFTATDGSGAYSFTGLVVGNSYTLTVTKSGLVFTPAQRAYPSLSGDLANQNFTYGKQWTGSGGDALATNPSNWTSSEAPVAGDVVRFDNTNPTKGCLWNSTVTVAALQIKVTYSSSVVVTENSNMQTLQIQGGEFVMNASEVRLSKDFTHTAGTFRAAADSTLLCNGSVLQTMTMVKTSLGGNLYQNYFSNFRVAGSSTVRAGGDMIIDGSFSVSSGEFDMGTSTITLTGGTQVASASGSSLNWDDTGGTLKGSGTILFYSLARPYQINQSASNAFYNLTGYGTARLRAVSSLTVNGALKVGQSGDSVQFDWGEGYSHRVVGPAYIGPSLATATAMTIGISTVTFQNDVTIGTAIFSVKGGQIVSQGSRLEVAGQGTLLVESTGTGRFVFPNNGLFQLSQGGTLSIQKNSVFTSAAPAASRYAMRLSGTVRIDQPAVFDSMDKDGFRLTLGANPASLNYMDFRNGVTGGAALNFDPVTLASVTVHAAQFDATISTNVRARLDTSVISSADVYMTNSTGARSGPAYENDPSGVVNWGLLGAPSNVSGFSMGISSITWGWTIVNFPLGFVVKAATGGALSSVLGANTTSWIETGLSTNTQYSRIVESFVDESSAAASAVSRYTDAVGPANAAFTAVNSSSVTITWEANSNPATTTFVVERSTNDVVYVAVASASYQSLVPFTETGLQSQTRHTYRITAQNGDGKAAASVASISTTTSFLPPPSVTSLSPSTAENLGTASFTIVGMNFQTGATGTLRKNSLQISPSTFTVQSSTAIAAYFNLTGALAGAWDVEVQNPDGRVSVGSGSGLLTITDASSRGSIVIQSYSSESGLNFTTGGGESTLNIPAGAMSGGRVYFSVDPVNSPLLINPSLITAATSRLSGIVLVSDSLREIAAYESGSLVTRNFGSPASLSIAYSDQNNDDLIDGTLLRASTLRIAVLNETTGLWQPLSSRVDASAKKVTASLSHFSVYSVVGSPTAATLSQVKIYPNPWRPGGSGPFASALLTFSNLTNAGTISIYTLNAALVREIAYDLNNAGQATWDGKNSDGDNVASGLYLVRIKSDAGEVRVFKVGIER